MQGLYKTLIEIQILFLEVRIYYHIYPFKGVIETYHKQKYTILMLVQARVCSRVC